MARNLIIRALGTVWLAGCALPIQETVPRPSDRAVFRAADQTTRMPKHSKTAQPAMILIQDRSAPAIRLAGELEMEPKGLPDLTGLKFNLYIGDRIEVVTRDGRIWAGQTRKAGKDLRFAIDLSDGARISGLLHLMPDREPATFVTTMMVIDVDGETFSGRGEFRAYAPETPNAGP